MAFTHSDQPPADKHGAFMKLHRRSSVSAPLMFVIVIVALIFVMSVFFRVSDIQVVGNSHYSDIEIIRAVDIEEGDNLFFFDRFAAISRAFAKMPYIEEVSVERSLPNKVIIEVTESEAMAYLVLGDEFWTLDHNCKVLGKASEEELTNLIPIEGIKPGTLLIGEQMATEDGDQGIVDFLSEVLYQIQERSLTSGVTYVDFTDPSAVEFTYGGRFTVQIGGSSDVEYKFGMFVSVLEQLSSGDVGLINISDGKTAHFMSE
ncbi:MAG: cell division protein FtsQ/DivIB [Candidatus Limivicinus sp.]|jgi:cell division protein FtsQ